jgi:transposase-like protein
MMHISRERTIIVCYQFFKELTKRFGRKPIFAGGARWYKDACKWLTLKQQVYATEVKNIMERFIQKIKDRTECFDDHFHVDRKVATDNMLSIGSKCLLCFVYETDRIKPMKFLTQIS